MQNKTKIIQDFCDRINSKYDVAIDIGQYNDELNIIDSTDIYGSNKTLRQIINEILIPEGFICDNFAPPLPGCINIYPTVPNKIGCLWVCYYDDDPMYENGFAIVSRETAKKGHLNFYRNRPNLWNARFED